MERLLKNDQVINLHHVRHHPFPVDPAALLICHPNRRFLSLNEQFVNKDDKIKAKVLKELNLLFYAPEETIYALNSSTLLTTLFAYLSDAKANSANRHMAATVTEQMLSQKIGQEQFVALGKLDELTNLLTCADLRIKQSAFKAVEHFSENKCYRQKLLKSGVLLVIFENLSAENDETVVKTACQILKNLLEENGIPVTCVSYTAHENLIKVASSYQIETVWEALDCLAALSQCCRSKPELVKAQVHQKVVSLFFKHRHIPDTVQRIFLILTNLCQIVDAKNAIVEQGFVKMTLEYLNQYESNKSLFLNTILFLTTLAEHQNARAELREHVERIEPFCSELFYPTTCEYAQSLLEVINWSP